MPSCHHEQPRLRGLLAALAGHVLLCAPAASALLVKAGSGTCSMDLEAWAEKRVQLQLKPWAKTGITKPMFQHALEYTPRWRRPGWIELVEIKGKKVVIQDGLDLGTKAWFNYTKRAVEHWPFEQEELKAFRMVVGKGDFPMLLKGDPNADPSLNAPIITNTNNGNFWEVMMPVSWRPQFDVGFEEERTAALRIGAKIPWRQREDVAVWRGVVGCATGCGARGKAYFPQGTLDTCKDDATSDWDANAIGATWGCGDDSWTNSSLSWTHHPRVELVNRFATGKEVNRCGIDVGFHTYQRHGAWLRKRVERSKLESWMKNEMSDEETAGFKYIFHVGNNGYSDRSWRMFALGAVVLLVDNGWSEWYFSLMEPWVHYIPVKADSSNACEVLHWARKNSAAAQKIAENGREFVEKCMTESLVDLYTAEVIRQMGALWELGDKAK
eukprot:CAMPEP_0171163168 /NCGR_PEP_ID=MMETSP0790-20130122/4994_1 /TAXON_ID=2925 /ORGANISM="Alexandrium catenella, Strain OF101" /LENGTH=439 /DNA_ID=CAMNT_0011627845 /DNA_START=52 /DNA_END=1371 /DNA_ORIENTATION=+